MVSVPEGIVANIHTTRTFRNVAMVKIEGIDLIAGVPSDPKNNNKKTNQGQGRFIGLAPFFMTCMSDNSIVNY